VVVSSLNFKAHEGLFGGFCRSAKRGLGRPPPKWF
jgi:hypothetical protein